jgi:hypothetical protein
MRQDNRDQSAIQNQLRPPVVFENSGLRQKSGPYIVKRLPRLWISTLEDCRTFAEGNFLDQLVDTYRDVFGHGAPVDKKGWGEYARCENLACIGKLSLESVHGLDSYVYIPDLEKHLPFPDLPPCPLCQSSMTLFYSPQELRNDLQEDFSCREIYGAFLTSEDGRLYGFSYGWADSLQKIWETKFQEFYRPSDITFQACIEQCQRHFDCESQLFYWAEGGHLLVARNRNIFSAMTQSLLSDILSIRGDLQCVFSTIQSSSAHSLMLGAGAKVVCSFGDHPLQILSAKVSDLWEEWMKPPAKFFRDNRIRIQRALKDRKVHSGAG